MQLDPRTVQLLASPDLAVTVADRQGRVVDANAAAARLLGVSRELLVGRSATDFVPTDQHDVHEARRQEILKRGRGSGRRTLRATDGRIFDVHILTVMRGAYAVSVWSVESPMAGSPLTPRESEVLSLTAGGMTRNEIAEQLGLSPETVRTHLGNAVSRLGARSRTHAVALAIASGWLNPTE